jgi:hypothetical protein
MLIEQAPDGGVHCIDRDGFRRELNALVQRACVTPGTSTLKRVISLRHVSCLRDAHTPLTYSCTLPNCCRIS